MTTRLRPNVLKAVFSRCKMLHGLLLSLCAGLGSFCRADILLGSQTFGPGYSGYTVPSGATQIELEVWGRGGSGIWWGDSQESTGGGGGWARARYQVSGGQSVDISINNNLSSATINGNVVSATPGGNAWEENDEGNDGNPGTASYATGTGYVANSGSTIEGGANNGGGGGESGGNGGVIVRAYNSSPPVITSGTNISGPAATTVSYQITATPSPSSYGASGLPSGLSINTSTGLISGTLASTGTYTFTITATNPNGTGQAGVTWVVNAAPVAGTATNISGAGATANWTSVTGTLSHYLLDLSTSSSFATFVPGFQAKNVGMDTSHPFVGLMHNTSYYYRVRAVYAVGTGANSNVISFLASSGTLLATQNYNTPGTYYYTIPPNVARVAFTVKGGGGYGAEHGEEWSYGGGGGLAAATYSATPGQVVSISVGAGGGAFQAGGSSSVSLSGYSVSSGGGGNAWQGGSNNEWNDGNPGTGAFSAGTAYISGSGFTVVGGAENGGAPQGDHGSVKLELFAAPPEFTSQPQSLVAGAGTGVTFSVGYSGNPVPTFQWRKNGTDITGATQATLAIPNVQSGDAAVYTVVLTNVGGTATSAGATLTVTDPPPNAPTALNYAERTATTVTLIWKSANDNIGVTHYNVYRGGIQIGTTTDVTYADNGLTPDISYSYTVKAVDTASQLSSASNTLNVTTTQDFTLDTDQDSVPNAVEIALGTTATVAAGAATTIQTQQLIHRPIQ